MITNGTVTLNSKLKYDYKSHNKYYIFIRRQVYYL